MPRPRNPDGGNVNLCVRISENLLAEIDAARGDQSRSDWGRDAFLAALGHQRPAIRQRGQRVARSEAPPAKPAKAASPGSPPRPRKGSADCSHRLQSGAWCKTCQQAKP